MKKLQIISAAAAVMALGVTAASAGTLQDVQARGELRCIVSTGLAGLLTPIQLVFIKALTLTSAARQLLQFLVMPSKVKFVPATGKTRFTILNSGEGDVLWRNTTWTFVRDVDVKLTFVGVNYYDGQGFMAPKSLGVKSAKDLDGATVCIQTGTTTELNLADFFRSNKISYEPVPIETNDESRTNYLAGRCDVYTTDASGLAATRSTFPNPKDHVILPEIISKEPLGPVVRHGDDQWGDVIRWVLNATRGAEELGVTQANVAEMAKGTNNPEINRMLGTEGDLGAMLGLQKDWGQKVIGAVGNYSEIFERHIGKDTDIGLDRGLNALWTDGGIQYSPPFR